TPTFRPQVAGKYEATKQATRWLSEQVASLKTSLEESEAAVENFMAASPQVNDEAMRAAASRLEDLRGKLREVVGREASLRERLEHVETLRAIDDFGAIAAALQDSNLAGLAREIG